MSRHEQSRKQNQSFCVLGVPRVCWRKLVVGEDVLVVRGEEVFGRLGLVRRGYLLEQPPSAPNPPWCVFDCSEGRKIKAEKEARGS